MFTNKPTKLRHVQQHLTASTMPQAILLKGKHLHELAKKLHAVLPEPLANQCKLANVHNRQLVFLASSAHWATQLRAIELPLLQAASELSSLQLQTLTVKVEPSIVATQGPVVTHSIPRQSAQHLLATANHLNDNPRLQQALRNLAKHTDKTEI